MGLGMIGKALAAGAAGGMGAMAQVYGRQAVMEMEEQKQMRIEERAEQRQIRTEERATLAKEAEIGKRDQLAKDITNQRAGAEITQAQSAIDAGPYSAEKKEMLKGKVGEGYQGLINTPTTMDRLQATATRTGDSSGVFNAEEKIRDNESRRVERGEDLALREEELKLKERELRIRASAEKRASETKVSFQTMSDGRIAIVDPKNGNISGYMKDPVTRKDISGSKDVAASTLALAKSYFDEGKLLEQTDPSAAKAAYKAGRDLLSGGAKEITPEQAQSDAQRAVATGKITVEQANERLKQAGFPPINAPTPAATPEAPYRGFYTKKIDLEQKMRALEKAASGRTGSNKDDFLEARGYRELEAEYNSLLQSK